MVSAIHFRSRPSSHHRPYEGQQQRVADYVSAAMGRVIIAPTRGSNIIGRLDWLSPAEVVIIAPTRGSNAY